MDRNKQNSWGTWDPKNDTMVSFWSFLFASYIAESELKKLATQKCQQTHERMLNTVITAAAAAAEALSRVRLRATP